MHSKSKQEILFSNAGIQNQDYDLDDKPYKMTGIVAAQVLNHLHGNPEVVHSWNTVGVFNDESSVSADQRLDQKYNSNFMQQHLKTWDKSGTLEVYRDDNQNFAKFAVKVLRDSMRTNKNLYIAKDDFTYCAMCKQTIAESNVSIGSCPICRRSDELKIKTEDALFVDLPDNRRELLSYHMQYNKVNLKHEISTLDNVPPRLLLSRDRKSGIDLNEVNLPNKKIDPRLGIGLLAVFIASQHGYESAGLTQSASTLIRTVPYLSSVLPDTDMTGVPRYKYAFHGKISPELLKSDRSQPDLLAFQSLVQRNDVNDSAYNNILSQVQITTKKLQQLKQASGLKPDGSIELIDEVVQGELSKFIPTVSKSIGRSIELTKEDSHEANQALIRASIRRGELVKDLYRE